MIAEGIASIEDLERGPHGEGGGLAGKRVFVRVDFNVPLDKKTRRITDDSRIRAALPTIEFAVKAGAKVILASHLGRPKGKPDPAQSLEPCGTRLAELTGWEVHLPEDCIGDAPKKVIRDLRTAGGGSQARGGPQLCLLENLRFHPEEEKDDEAFCKALAELCDVYVSDAFGAVHRPHASVHGLPRLMRDRGAGFLVLKELQALGRLVESPPKPYAAVLGGAKVSDKIAVIEALLAKVDLLCIGGAMANTFLAAQGKNVQRSLVEADKLPLARSLIEKAEKGGVELLLPVDVVVAPSTEATSGTAVRADAIPEGMMALDIGPDSAERFARAIRPAKSIFWNGPMGMFETEAFAAGTRNLALAMSRAEGFTVVGGGDSAAAVYQAGEDVAGRFGHISTGGGASLELIEGRRLPGVEALRR
ncbi:MAG: phosphoglycerate kinase [Deltaproteobacteria bacterium]|nr:phosphoglycerate kinase [Deltaproteobacteria bacterium]